MFQDQLYLLASVFATRRDAQRLKLLLRNCEAREDFWKAICVLWPELDEPANLRFLFDSDSSGDLGEEDLFAQLIDSDDRLISIVEMDHGTTLERSEQTKKYVKSRLDDLNDDVNYQLTEFEARWMRWRMLLCNRFEPRRAALYKPLWNFAGNDPMFMKWIHGVIEPLDHINKRLDRSIAIEEFEQMVPSDVFKIILNSEPEFPTTVISREIIPYLVNNNLYNLFLDDVFSTNNFPLSFTSNLRAFRQIIVELPRSLPEPQYESKILSRAAEIIFENSSNVLDVSGSSELCDLLSYIDDDVQMENSTLTVASLKHFAKCIGSVYKSQNLKELYSISREGETAQLAHFSSIAREQMLSSNSNERTVEIISLLMDNTGSADTEIFTQLSPSQKASAFIETALEFGKFELLSDFLVRFDSDVDEGLLVKYFWHFFNKASNGLSTRPEMRNAQKTLLLLNKKSNSRYIYMKALLEVANELSTYSLNLGKGVPFKPSDILDFAAKPLDLVSLLLELNPGLYRKMRTTSEILKKLKIGLQTEDSFKGSSDQDLASLLALHVDHSLANMDFNFALEKTKELLKMDNIASHWPTIFQVGKFIDPQWPDGEAPVDVLAVQMEILGELLHVCPVEESEVVVSQWSALELELVTRDPIHAQYSEECVGGPENVFQRGVLSNGISSKFTGFLSGSRL